MQWSSTAITTSQKPRDLQEDRREEQDCREESWVFWIHTLADQSFRSDRQSEIDLDQLNLGPQAHIEPLFLFAMEGAQSCDNAHVKRVPSSPEEDGTLKNCLETFGTGQNQMFSLRKAGISKGSSPQLFYRCLILLLLLVNLAPLSNGDVGTAAQYEAPFSPTACYGTNEAQFPSSEEFGSAGEAIWDNGEACGRLYEVQCISGPDPTTCIPGQIVQVRIVDHALTSVSRPSWDDATMVLSTTAFGKISNASATFINIQYIPA